MEKFIQTSKLCEKDIILHASLRSVGHIDGGADTLIDAFVEHCNAFYVPSFSYESNTNPPESDKPERNGCDYAFYKGWNKPKIPFNPKTSLINEDMGIVSKTLFRKKNTIRSAHPWNSWLGHGLDAYEILNDHDWSEPNLPLKKLLNKDSFVVLMGVGFDKCTAIHLAEEFAGRKYFIRWMVDENGITKRVYINGCGKGFVNLENRLRNHAKHYILGGAETLVLNLRELVENSAYTIKNEPYITKCSDGCFRCEDILWSQIHGRF